MNLRPYQKHARDKARAEYSRGARAICYVAPTGAGKTVILGDTIVSHLKHHASPRVNVYAHRRELITQAADTFRRFGLEVGSGGEGKSAPVQVLSTQAVLARGEVEACTMAVFDEAHHYAADTWGDVAKAHKEHGAIIVGATATPERGDGRPLDHLFDSLVVVAQVRELVSLGALVPCEIIKASRKPRKGHIAQRPAAAYERYAKGRRAVVFAPHVKAATEFAAEFPLGTVEVISGDMPSWKRDAALREFRDHGGVLVNCNVLTEGWDDPGCDCIILARQMGSVGMMIQACGRGARPGPGKRSYLVLDLMGITSDDELGRPDADREYSLTGEGISRGGGVLAEERLCKMCQAALGDAEVCPRCGHFNGLVTPESAGIELEAWKVSMRKEDDGKKIERLARWIRPLLSKGGRAVYSAQYKFAAVYGVKPDAGTWGEAMRRAKG